MASTDVTADGKTNNMNSQEQKESLSNNQTVGVIIVSIFISALVVRIFYVWFEAIKIWCEDMFDEKRRDDYARTKYYVLNSVLVILLCLFLILIILEAYKSLYLNNLE